ncbi:hypothetical protein B0H34DRAFT_500304 [Crassisporium funariophilum]|nr:hypothetical protein B0H34DRAFT_500304 [Crassisporium funariophilum]
MDFKHKTWAARSSAEVLACQPEYLDVVIVQLLVECHCGQGKASCRSRFGGRLPRQHLLAPALEPHCWLDLLCYRKRIEYSCSKGSTSFVRQVRKGPPSRVSSATQLYSIHWIILP